MNILTTSVLLLLSISLGVNQQQPEVIQKTKRIEKMELKNGFTVKDKDYTLYFDIENTDSQQPTLIITIDLHNNSHYISPNAKRDFKGKFYMDLGNYDNLGFKGSIKETPLSVEEFDSHPFVNGTVNWVRESTTYKQVLEIKSIHDFEVFGRVQFTIEPRRTFEEISFSISYQNGIMKLIEPKC